MGYDIHITRQENWFDEHNDKQISPAEWKDLLANDPEMRSDNSATATTTSDETIRIENEDLAVWTKYSGNGINGNFAWFYYHNGNIICKNPDDEIILKMLHIAKLLEAKVQGDEGELYEPTTDQKITLKQLQQEGNKQLLKVKPWWKFW